MKILGIVLLLASTCFSSPTEPGSANGSITLRFGETAVAGGTRVSFTDVTDSRCPRDVVCAWEGDAAVRLESGNDHVVLHTSGRMGAAEASLGGVTLTLVDVRPVPDSRRETSKTDYSVTLRVSR
jgi:hypothetical protein